MIDWSRINELRDEIGSDGFQEVIDLFLEETEMAIRDMQTLPADATTREGQMHFLKGASLNFGFKGLSQICQTGEKAAASGDLNAVTPNQIELMFMASKVDFLSGLDSNLVA